jgi:ABC-2 type transport system permease protein
VLTAAILFAGVKINAGIPLFPLLIFYFSFIFTNLGLGFIGASNFFNLEVKQGREPFTWLVDVMARIFSGIYYPLAVLPSGLVFISRLIPHTYAMEGLRLVMLSGQGLENPVVRNNVFIMLGFALLAMLVGIISFDKSLERAYRGNGVGIIV